MPDTTINPPFRFSDQQSINGFSYLFAAEAVRQEIADRLDAMGLGLVPLVGDLAGTGTDTLRNVRVDNVGWAARFSALASENATVAPSSMALGYDAFTVGMYAYGMQETWKQQVLGRAGSGLHLDDLVQLVPTSYLSTWRYLFCVTGATIGGSAIGSSGADQSVDDHVALVAYFDQRLGAAGTPVVTVSSQQMSQLKASYRSEPAFANFGSDFANIQKFDGGQRYVNFAGLGIDVVVTDDVQQSGGAYQGFAMRPGAMGWVRASTSSIRSESQNRIDVPEYGMVVVRTGEDETRTDAFEATAFLGMGLADASVAPQVRFISKV